MARPRRCRNSRLSSPATQRRRSRSLHGATIAVRPCAALQRSQRCARSRHWSTIRESLQWHLQQQLQHHSRKAIRAPAIHPYRQPKHLASRSCSAFSNGALRIPSRNCARSLRFVSHRGFRSSCIQAFPASRNTSGIHSCTALCGTMLMLMRTGGLGGKSCKRM